MPDVASLEQTDCRRSWYRKSTVGGFYRAVTERNLGVVDAIAAEQLDAPDRSHDIKNCIDRSNFVQMQIIGRDTMDGALDRRDRFERRVSLSRDSFRKLYRIDQSMNLRNRSAVWLRWNVEIDFDALHSRSLHIRDAN